MVSRCLINKCDLAVLSMCAMPLYYCCVESRCISNEWGPNIIELDPAVLISAVLRSAISLYYWCVRSLCIIAVWNNNNNNNYNNRIQRRYSRFFTISSQRRELSPTRTLKWPGRNRVQITCNTSSAYHVQVSYYVPLGTKEQLSYSVWQSWNRIYLSFILMSGVPLY